jgi:hypothetical protein
MGAEHGVRGRRWQRLRREERRGGVVTAQSAIDSICLASYITG